MKNRFTGQPAIAETPDLQIELDLSRYCIQTVARRRYETLLAAYFHPAAERIVLEKKIGLLQQALETLDFGALRSRWPQLAGGRPIKVRLEMSAGRILIHNGGQTIRAPVSPETDRDKSGQDS